MRKKKHGAERLQACGEYVLDGGLCDPKSVFENGRPVHLEIGCGKGDFICGMAAAEPDINFIAIERIPDVLTIAAEKVKAAGYGNVRLAAFNAAYLAERIAPHSISRIYLNFSDPWPKDRHAKRRLPSRQFLERYDQILKKDGIIEFKTDNRGLFDFAVEEIAETKWKIDAVTYDLHHDEKMMEGNVMTEYEERFSSQGNPICKYVISR
jgi:tRNA (guanine-N7-)-methyltransferase